MLRRLAASLVAEIPEDTRPSRCGAERAVAIPASRTTWTFSRLRRMNAGAGEAGFRHRCALVRTPGVAATNEVHEPSKEI